jgi:MFS family permease
MSATQHDSTYSWIRLGLSLGLSIVGNIGMWAVIVVLPDIQAEFGIDRATATIPYAAAMVGFAVGNLTLGPAVDRYGITPVLAIAAVIISAGFGLSAISGSVLTLSAVHVVLGIGTAACFAPIIADVSQWFLKRRGIAVAIAASGNYFSGTFWPPLMVPLMADFGWRGTYALLGAVVLVVVLPGAMLLRRRIDAISTARATAAAEQRAQSTGLNHRTLQILLAIAGVGCCVAMSMPQVHIVALCIDRGFGPAAGADMLSLMLAGGVASRLFFGALSDRIGGLKTLLLGASLQCVALCLFLIEGGLSSLYVVSLVFGLSQGGIVPSYAIIVREYMSPREAGRRVGLVMAATIIGMALGGWLSGWLYDLSGSYAMAVWNGIGWNLITIAIALGILIRIGAPRATAT